MRQQVLLDTGPLVALINRRDRFHQWVKTEWEQIESPLLTCEAVITEASFNKILKYCTFIINEKLDSLLIQKTHYNNPT